MKKNIYHFKILFLGMMAMISCFEVMSQIKVSGKVISSEDNEPLPGVTVLVKGTTTGVITDLEGDYAINVGEDATLVFSFVGFASKEIPYNGQSQIDVTLAPDIQALDEIVVLGYSQKSQKELSASVVSLDAKELNNVTSPNVQTMLQGKVPGLTVSSPSGQPGAVADIRIRGITSLNSDQPPLFVVDGMIGGNFVPNDVETITVLKDAAAIGLYGSRGAAGVIIVTTKQATGGDPVINFSSKVGFKEAVTGNFEMMNSEQLYETQRAMWGDANQVSFLTNRPESLLDQDYNWMEAGFEKAILHNHNLSMRGKGDKMAYGFSVDYFNEEGTFIKTDYERLNLRGNLKFSPSKRMSIHTDINAQVTNNNINHYTWFEDVFWNVPWDKPTHMEDGLEVLSGPQYVTNPANRWIGQFKRNFLHSAEYNSLSNRGQDVVWSTNMSYDLTNWLSIETRTRLNSYNSSYKEYSAPNTSEGIALNGVVLNTQSEGYGILSTHFLRFSQTFGDHDISAFVAHEGSYGYSKGMSITGINLTTPSIDVLSGASEIQSHSGSDYIGRGISFISELSYSYQSKYLATAYWRADGDSKFAENKRFGYFPGGSLAWIVTEESVLSGSSALTFLKLRTSYGHTGNSNIPPFKSLPTYSLSRRYNGNPAAEPNNPANPDLGWETTKMWNFGVDVELLGSLSLTADIYQKSVEDMLLTNPLAFSTGYESRIENIGDMRNRGVEVLLSYTKNFGDFSYNGSFNISFNDNEITKVTDILDEQPVVAGAIQQINSVGNEAFMWYMPKWLGVNPDDGSPMWEVINFDENGNETGRGVTGVYNDATFQPIESALPTYSGGLNNALSYKGLTFSFLFTFQGGNHIYHYTREYVDSDGANTGVNFMQLQDGWSRWEQPGDEATHPVLMRGGSNGAHNTSSRYMEKGDFIRLRNVSLAYSLPEQLISWANIGAASLSVSADNLLTFTEFTGMDPDIGLQKQEWSLPGMSYLKYPISKQVIIGLNINF